jgi:hypothetical protein
VDHIEKLDSIFTSIPTDSMIMIDSSIVFVFLFLSLFLFDIIMCEIYFFAKFRVINHKFLFIFVMFLINIFYELYFASTESLFKSFKN